MEEKQENLLSNLKTAHDLLHHLAKLQSQVDQILAQQKEKKKKGHRGCKIVIAVVLAFSSFILLFFALEYILYLVALHVSVDSPELALSLINLIDVTTFSEEFLWICIAILTVVWYIVIAKIADRRRAKKNTQIEEYNQELSKKTEPIKQEISALVKQWNSKVASWYPKDYVNVEAVDFFLSAVRNHRANTIKEAVNLWEEEKHQRRMEQTQERILEQTRQVERNTNWRQRQRSY